MTKTIRNNGAARDYIANRVDFRNPRGTFSGDIVSTAGGGWPHPLRYTGLRYTGRLPRGFHDSLAKADYVVYSYSTPIGWHVPFEGWHVPEVTYSATTSGKHQPILRSAVWDDLTIRPSWQTIPESATAANILRSIRAGYGVVVKGKTRRVVDLVLETGEAVREGDSLVPANGSHIRSEG